MKKTTIFNITTIYIIAAIAVVVWIIAVLITKGTDPVNVKAHRYEVSKETCDYLHRLTLNNDYTDAVFESKVDCTDKYCAYTVLTDKPVFIGKRYRIEKQRVYVYTHAEDYQVPYVPGMEVRIFHTDSDVGHLFHIDKLHKMLDSCAKEYDKSYYADMEVAECPEGRC